MVDSLRVLLLIVLPRSGHPTNVLSGDNVEDGFGWIYGEGGLGHDQQHLIF